VVATSAIVYLAVCGRSLRLKELIAGYRTTVGDMPDGGSFTKGFVGALGDYGRMSQKTKKAAARKL
jgi:hypothetical protein